MTDVFFFEAPGHYSRESTQLEKSSLAKAPSSKDRKVEFFGLAQKPQTKTVQTLEKESEVFMCRPGLHCVCSLFQLKLPFHFANSVFLASLRETAVPSCVDNQGIVVPGLPPVFLGHKNQTAALCRAAVHNPDEPKTSVTGLAPDGADHPLAFLRRFSDREERKIYRLPQTR